MNQWQKEKYDKYINCDWSKLAMIASPDKWLKVYEHYQELIEQQDVASFWSGEYDIANRERNELKEKLKQYESK